MLTERQRAEKVAECQGDWNLGNKWVKVNRVPGVLAVRPKQLSYYHPSGAGEVLVDIKTQARGELELCVNCQVSCDDKGKLWVTYEINEVALKAGLRI